MAYMTSTGINRLQSGINSITASKTLNTDKDPVGTIVLNAAAGLTLTLPEAKGSGMVFDIAVGTTVTSNSYVIDAGTNGGDFFGNATLLQDGADTVAAFEAAADNNTFTMNGSTQGGLKGGTIRLTDIGADEWLIEATSAATGTEATPFSTV